MDARRIGSRSFGPALLLALLLSMPTQAPGQTGESKDSPESAAEALLEKRVPAGDAAAVLVERYRQTAEQAVGVLLRAGYRDEAVARAAVGPLRMRSTDAAAVLRSGKVPAAVVVRAFSAERHSTRAVSGALRDAGYDARDAAGALAKETSMKHLDAFVELQSAGYGVGELSRAVSDLGMEVDMDCLGPDGFPAPCGNLGADNNEPAMGQVSWLPPGSAQVGTIIEFQSTNIPAVDVLLGGTELEVVEMTPGRVRARMPDFETTGALAFRRQSDGVVGVIEDPYQATAPPVSEPAFSWSGAGDAALRGALEDADQWIVGSRFDDSRCRVMATNAIGQAGVLGNPSGFDGNVRSELEAMGIPSHVAQAWQDAFEEAFLAWADRVTIPGLPLYPAFAAWPGEKAPPVPNVPAPIATLVSGGVAQMTPGPLTGRLNESLPGADAAGAAAEIAGFANELGATFGLFLAQAQVMLVMGEGPVPSFAPPQVPVGPVVDGRCYSDGPWTSLLPSGTQVQLPDSWK